MSDDVPPVDLSNESIAQALQQPDPRLMKSVLLGAVAGVARRVVKANGRAIDAVAGKPPKQHKPATDSGVDPKIVPVGTLPIGMVLNKVGIGPVKIAPRSVGGLRKVSYFTAKNKGHGGREERRRLRRMEQAREDRKPIDGGEPNTLSSGW